MEQQSVSLNGWRKRQLRSFNEAIKILSKQIQVAPMKDGSIACMLGNEQDGNITFVIEANVVFDAALVGLRLAEEFKQKEFLDAAKKTDTQPVRGE